ncbi:DUF6894 family protein [Sphingomonas immobilis]|uniref:DUF6894 domain-containing protein n=1 Tax=Sphingomonas immobilis TaxID=3063997 RepID=A0ABT8ZWG2_9SPHN|nr:hypothetical protein [Sphingomonas sp. CA1-15]MDO7841919.1 hypothetical protein [Sphingomonas sp. CA1-15]
MSISFAQLSVAADHLRRMSRYYFHVFNDEETRDDEGQEFPDVAAAHARARYEVQRLAAHSITEHGHLVLHHRIEVEDQDGNWIATVQFGDVVEIRQ